MILKVFKVWANVSGTKHFPQKNYQNISKGHNFILLHKILDPLMNNLLHILSGTWFIISTNFPMWLKPNIQSPTFNYTLIEKKGTPCLLDEVKYLKNGKVKTITGYDYPDLKNDKAFTWRGKGLLFIAKSRWEVRLIDEKQQWAVIYFSKTLFTPEGLDIISRTSTLDKTTLEDIKVKMGTDSTLKKQVNSLQNLSQKTD